MPLRQMAKVNFMKTRQVVVAEIAGLEFAGQESEGWNRRGGICRTGKWRTGKWRSRTRANVCIVINTEEMNIGRHALVTLSQCWVVEMEYRATKRSRLCLRVQRLAENQNSLSSRMQLLEAFECEKKTVYCSYSKYESISLPLYNGHRLN